MIVGLVFGLPVKWFHIPWLYVGSALVAALELGSEAVILVMWLTS